MLFRWKRHFAYRDTSCVLQKNLENRNNRLRRHLKARGGEDPEIEMKLLANDRGKPIKFGLFHCAEFFLRSTTSGFETVFARQCIDLPG